MASEWVELDQLGVGKTQVNFLSPAPSSLEGTR
jgi:hypothetical protein